MGSTRKNQQGSALLVAVVVMLVLSGIGMAIIAVTDTERETAAWNSHSKDAMYVAEMGLRVGERVLRNTAQDNTVISNLMAHVTSTQTMVVTPHVPVFPQTPAQMDLTRLGTYVVDGANELANQPVALPGSPTGRPVPDAFFSVYVRNNPEDVNMLTAGSPSTDDDDFRVRLVSVGWVQKAGNILAVKILEEEFGWTGITQDPSTQKLKDAGGTSSALFGG